MSKYCLENFPIYPPSPPLTEEEAFCKIFCGLWGIRPKEEEETK